MNVLLLGSGGREHAIGWKLVQSPRVTRLISAPGNPGLAEIGDTVAIDITDPTAVLVAAANADLVVIGPEAPLAAGVADALHRNGIPVFGPAAAGARLESSKAFAKHIMQRAGVPTAGSETFTDADEAHAHIAAVQGPYVVKADGLAAGKGVLVTNSAADAHAWVGDCFGGRFGSAGDTVVIEEYLPGTEVSIFAVCDGTAVVPLVAARDYKRLRDGDFGPNTGGMGAFSPVPDISGGLIRQVIDYVVRPVLGVLRDDGVMYRGFLYTGLMLTPQGPKVLEFNCRLGDPEAQVILPRLESDLAELLEAVALGTLREDPLEWSDDAAVDVVIASQGYPDAPAVGRPIDGLKTALDVPGVVLFHAGTGRDESGTLVTTGGRVINVVGTGPDLATARGRAYEAADAIIFSGRQFRTDIAQGA